MRTRFLSFVLAAVSALAQFPGKTWLKHDGSGWSAPDLAVAREYAATIDTAAVTIVQQGKVVAEWGETTRKFNCHSIRKSLLSALYGIHVGEGRIDVKKTLGELGIDDCQPALTDVEKKATVLDLLKARSGVYHAALYETLAMKAMRPARGSHAPGTFWYYNNWDFNALGTIFEKATGTRLFEEFKKRIAEPLGMEDFETGDGTYFTGPDSIHAAYPFRMTGRDLARFGVLYLREGRWRDRQIVPRQWVRDSLRPWSDASAFTPGDAYGYMWWVRKDGFSAEGAGGHILLVIPKRDLVIVHRVNTDEPGRNVPRPQFDRLVELILYAGRR